MRVFVDTSVLAAYYLPEPLSTQADRFLRNADPAVISELVELELASALSRKERMGELSAADADRVRSLFASQLASHLFERLVLDREHYRLAREWITAGLSPLRSLDALHLATAHLADAPLLTADRALAAAARAHDVDFSWIEEGRSGMVHEPAPDWGEATRRGPNDPLEEP